MKRSELCKLLELISPALSDTNLALIYTCFMFGSKRIAAYNDTIGISANCTKSGFGTSEPFATGGATLLGLLQNSQADDVDFQLTDECLVVKTGKSTFKLPYFPEKDFLFIEPKEKWAASIELSADLLRGMSICLTTTSRDQSQPAIAGVCFNFDKKDPVLYSCDSDAITRVYGSGKHKGTGTYTVPNPFCDALLKVAQETETDQGTLELNDAWAKATLNNGFTIYGRMIVNDKPLDHASLIDQSLNGKQHFAALPLGLADALARARVVADPESAKTVMTIAEGKLKLMTDTPLGVVRDELKIKNHPDAEAVVHASLVHRSIGICDEISVRDNVTAYRLGETVLQVVGNMSK